MLNYAHVLMAGTPMSILRPIPCFPVPMSSWLVPYDDAKAHVVPFSVHVFNAGSPTTMLRGILHCLVAICSWQLAVRAYWSTCHAPVCPRAHVEMQPCWRREASRMVADPTQHITCTNAGRRNRRRYSEVTTNFVNVDIAFSELNFKGTGNGEMIGTHYLRRCPFP